MQRLGILLLSAIAYFACGKLGIYLAIPPGYATAVWPSSGVALVLAIRFGSLSLAGIWLGSFFINAGITKTFAHPSATSLMIPAVIALGAVAQAAVGSWLAGRFAHKLWASVQSILYILLLGGPLSCLLAASVGVTTLLLFDQITINLYRDIWVTWWIGDTLGVLAFTPALLVLLSSPKTVMLSKRLMVVAPLVIMFGLVTIAYIFVRDFEEQQRKELVFQTLSDIRHNVEQELKVTEEITEILATYFSSKDTPSVSDFQSVTDQYLRRHKSIQAIEWVPLVENGDRLAFEAAQRVQIHPNFKITERGAQGEMLPAQTRAEYFPVTYVNPLSGNEAALGFDLGSNTSRRLSIVQAAEQQVTVISDPIHLVQLQENQYGYLILKPVFTSYSPRPESLSGYSHLAGFILLVFVPDELIEAANPGLNSSNLFFNFYDISSPEERIAVISKEGGLSDYQQYQSISLANKKWELVLAPTALFLQQAPHWQSYAVLLSGWPFIMVLSVLLIMLVGRQISIESIVEEKTAELEHATLLAQQASRAKSDFLANMSHELRTPLNSIIGFTRQVLAKKSEQLDSRTVDSLSTVERNAKHLLRLINDLLDISKIEAGRFELEYDEFNVLALCKEVAAPFVQQAREKQLELAVECGEDLMLEADRVRIYQTLLNLVANAFKFTSKGCVRIKAGRVSRGTVEGVEFSVSDSGRGIPALQQVLLFNKFVQLEEGRQTGSGTGLGLALAKDIVALHQGDIRVQSEVGQGSTFSFWVPLKPGNTAGALQG